MAKVSFNSAFSGFSGKSGNLVFRQLRGQTVLAQRPGGGKHTPSAAQKRNHKKFAEAGAYAKQVLADPLQRRSYEALANERNRRIDTMIIGDFLTPPVVEEIELCAYKKRPGGLIRVLATDDIEVVSVEVNIRTIDGALIEKGAATKIHGVWRYTTTVPVPDAMALTITAVAKDRPGHEGTHAVVCP